MPPKLTITADDDTLTQGDTTVFRTTVSGPAGYVLLGYEFVPVAPAAPAVAMRGNSALSALEAAPRGNAAFSARLRRQVGWQDDPPVLSESATAVPEENRVHFVVALAMRGVRALRLSGTVSGGQVVSPARLPRPAVRQDAPAVAGARATVVPVGKRGHFLDAEVECSVATEWVCYASPRQTGYEVVTARVDGEEQRDSVLVTVVPVLNPSELTLKCSDAYGVSDATGGATVVRGRSVSCKASVTPPGSASLAVTGWSFSSSGYPYTLTRSGVDDSTYARDSTLWSGPMFTSGRVTVSGKIGGVDQTASAAVLVTARPWNSGWLDSTRWIAKEVPHPYTDPPAADSELGLNSQSALRDYLSSYLKVEQGPNQGLLAFARFPVKLYFEVSVHYAAMSVGSKFYDMQPRSATGNYCSATTMVSSLPLVKKHEGFVPVDTVRPKLSHTFNYKYWFRTTLNDSAETFVDTDLDRFAERIERLRVWGDSVAADSSKAITHRRGSNPFTLSCRFNYDPAVRF